MAEIQSSAMDILASGRVVKGGNICCRRCSMKLALIFCHASGRVSGQVVGLFPFASEYRQGI